MLLQSPFSAVTSTVDGDVLNVLARADRGFTLPELQRLVPARSYMGLQNAAERLVEQGTLLIERVGRTRLYRLNREHLLADAIVAIATARTRFLERLRSACEDIPVLYAALFGSGARGEMQPDSDIDLFFVTSEDDARMVDNRVHDLAIAVRAWTGNPVNPVIYLDSGLSSTDPLLDSIVREGVLLAGSSRYLVRQVRGMRG